MVIKSPPVNIIVFGEAGVGKSSLINLIAGQAIASISSDAKGCTFQYQKYDLLLDHAHYAIWDTVGLDEGTGGTVPAQSAEASLKRLLRALIKANGVHLLIYCVRATRLRESLLKNYKLFYFAVCRSKVPIAIAITNLENYEPKGEMESWWAKNEAELTRLKMYFDGHACVTTLVPNSDDPPTIIERYNQSRQTILSMIASTSTRHHLGAEQETWLLAALADVKALLKLARKDGSQPTSTVAIYDLTQPPLDPTIPAKDKAPFEGCLRDISGTSFAVYRIRHQQVLSGARFTKEVVPRGADLLICCASIWINAEMCRQAVSALYKSYGGDVRPFLVVVVGAETDVVAVNWWKKNVPSTSIKAVVRALPSLEGSQEQVTAAVCEIQKVIQTRSLEPVDISPNGCFAWLCGGKQNKKLPWGDTMGSTLDQDLFVRAGVWAPMNA